MSGGWMWKLIRSHQSENGDELSSNLLVPNVTLPVTFTAHEGLAPTAFSLKELPGSNGSVDGVCVCLDSLCFWTLDRTVCLLSFPDVSSIKAQTTVFLRINCSNNKLGLATFLNSETLKLIYLKKKNISQEWLFIKRSQKNLKTLIGRLINWWTNPICLWNIKRKLHPSFLESKVML